MRDGRMQKTLAARPALSAPALAFEIYLEHYKGSFGDKWMWTPIVLTPPLTAAGDGRRLLGAGGDDGGCPRFGALRARRPDRHRHARPRRPQAPGGFAEPTYNLVMGPPLLAPGSLARRDG